MVYVSDSTHAPDYLAGQTFEERQKSARETAQQHGYYYSVLSEDEKIEYEMALSTEGFEQEIALVKAKLKCMLLLYPYNISMLARMLSILERLQRTQHTLFKGDKKAVVEAAVEKAINKLCIPPGIIEEARRAEAAMNGA